MHQIIQTEFVGPDVKKFEIHAPRIVSKWKAGQFIMLRIHDTGERIPLTIAETNTTNGTITLFVQGIGKTTKELNSLNKGDYIQDIAGPLGIPSDIQKYGTVITIGGGVGTAIAYPTTKALQQAGNQVIAIIGARTKDLIILEEQIRQVCDQLYVCTDDGSYGFHGFVTKKLEILLSQQQISLVHAVGPVPMMQNVAKITKEHNIKTYVSLNPLMIDGTGMCGCCRVTVNGQTLFACVDGPEFDAQQVDFDELLKRNSTYKKQEEESMLNHECKLEKKLQLS
ncbi:MAG TPA: sulfide/dihydroorotate dehydrogenase-like FAD/NAD-binding protein [Planctomycetota bacterium]|nr:sulfide/dihydroorotate dehydrogenase-like FAD/NAD-binding protein [Planctomycetota bacterium]HRU52472.1 sulfide/dihydroorotate dehydrogenase-like FAD/NAD-binding protein [Planctomycetota bacterium]